MLGIISQALIAVKDASCQVVGHQDRSAQHHCQGLQIIVYLLLFQICRQHGTEEKKPSCPHHTSTFPDSAEVVLAEEFAEARTTNSEVFSWHTKPTDGSRGGLGGDGDPSAPGKVAIPDRVLKLINCRSFIIAKNEDCAWAFGSYSC